MRKCLIKQEKYGGKVILGRHQKRAKKKKEAGWQVCSKPQVKVSMVSNSKTLGYPSRLGMMGLHQSKTTDETNKVKILEDLFQPPWAPSQSSSASLAAAELESWMFFIWDRQQLLMVMILFAICNVFQLQLTSNLILIILIIFIFQSPTEVPDKTHNDSAWTPPHANLTHWCNSGFALSPVIFHCKHKWIYCKGLLMQTQRSSLLMSQGQHGGAPNAQHSERRAPVSLTVRASCRGQTAVGKLRACCTVMFC